MADDDCIVLSDSDDGPPAPAAKRARGGAPAGADGDVELVDAQPAPLLADDSGGEASDDDDEVRVVGTKGEVCAPAAVDAAAEAKGPCCAARQRHARASSRAARGASGWWQAAARPGCRSDARLSALGR
jgi:hypothetical protein